MCGPHITDNFNENSVHQPRCMAVRSIRPNSEVQVQTVLSCLLSSAPLSAG